ncbi:hypothetical protein WJX74_008016 [Apatococcus lobatus]|uniref:Transmembrane protein 208 n=1 Tax=Apatococcus lobatus TaxID=904363 RepID=A0AAW1SAA1_9CHLO
MANQGAKRKLEQNKRRLRTLLQLIAVANVVYIVFRLFVFSSTRQTRHSVFLVVTSLMYFFCYRGLQLAADPAYDAQGELTDGGDDLTMGGTCEYLHDGIYLAAFCQLATPFLSDWLWLVFLAVPGYGIYLAWTSILQPYFASPKSKDIPETEEEKKRREKLERKQQRKQGIRYRR